MSLTIGRIRSEALRLPPEDRARLAGELINSLDELDEVEQAGVDAAWAEEIRRRVEQVRERKVELVDGEEVMKELRSRFDE